MKAAILAAGIGDRLQQRDPVPKVLLRLGGMTLLQRHHRILGHCGVSEMELSVGFKSELVEAALAALATGEGQAPPRGRATFNPQYDRGAIVSLCCLEESFLGGDDVVFMDGDVLYDHRMLTRLTGAAPGNYFLMDRHLDPGEDPVKLCMRDDVLVDFHKRPEEPHDWAGEWIGFARFTAEIAAKIHAAAARYVAADRLDEMYEEAIRDVLLAEPPGTFRVLDVSDLAWVEIDFPEDLAKAHEEILDRLPPLPPGPRDVDESEVA